MDKREQIVIEARSWIGTPYRIRGRVKGAGADCGTLLMSVAINCGMMENQELAVYSVDCWAHWKNERYMIAVQRHTQKLMEAVCYRTSIILPGSLVLTRAAHAKAYNHGGIVTKWPFVVHAVNPEVQEVDATKDFLWAYKEVAVFDFNRING